jgi:hypothetical protein
MTDKRSSPLTSRLYETEDDLLQMQNFLMEARSQTDDWRYAHVGDLLFSFFMVACHLDLKEHGRRTRPARACRQEEPREFPGKGTQARVIPVPVRV